MSKPIRNRLMLGILITAVLFGLSGCLSQKTGSDEGDEYNGGLVWNNWTKSIAGGTDELPPGVINKDFLRCKACHGWDAKGANGGYVRRSGFPEKDTRPKPTKGTDLSHLLGRIATADVEHVNGRSWTTENNKMPNLTQTGGLTYKQIDDVTAFLNKGPKIGDIATIDISQKPVKYTFKNADPASGKDLYAKSCQLCHGADGNQMEVKLIDYFRNDGKYSEGFHKIIYGADEQMTRAVAGNLNAKQAAGILSWIQIQADDTTKKGFSQ
ncbi:MAG TPA: c-type cytochrome [Spirochaetales bacterium]|nr:c-type cytochrome [Spirochaetales bacterium]